MLRVFLCGEPTAASAGIRLLFAGRHDVAIVAEAGSCATARTLLARDDYDAVLVDASGLGADAFDLAPAVRRGARVVFVVGCGDAMRPALEAAGVDTLIAPARREAIEALIEALAAARWAGGRSEGRGPFVAVKVDAVNRFIPIDEIRAIAACENYTEVMLAAMERIFVRRTLQQWGQLLPAAQFCRVHRGLLVNLDQVQRVERDAVLSTLLHFAGDSPPALQVKRRHWPALRVKLELRRTRLRLPRAASLTGKSLAVLAFANLSRDPANEHFCDGISEELLNVLAKIPGLRVAARTSSFSFKGRSLPIPEIAAQLGVAYVLEGSVRRAGRRVRVTAQLISGADGMHVWSDNFDRELSDVFALQDGIAALIARNLQLRLGEPVRPAHVVNPDAHWLTLEGRHYWSLRTEGGFGRAEAAFGQALGRDPAFAPAHAGLADVCNIRALYRLADGAVDVSEDLLRAKTGAERALQLDAALAEPHATLGFVALHEGRLADSEAAFARAFALNPNYANAYQFCAWAVCAQGDMPRALETYARSIALDPLAFINVDRHAAMLFLAGETAAALAVNERAATLRTDVFVGNLSQRAPILLALGRVDEAVAIARQVRTIGRDARFRRNADADAIGVLQRAGHAREADEYAAEILGRLPGDNYIRGFVLSALGRFEEAWPSLRHTPNIMLPQLYWSGMWDPVRTKPAFQQLIAQLGRSAEYGRARREISPAVPETARPPTRHNRKDTAVARTPAVAAAPEPPPLAVSLTAPPSSQ